jgi:hypothetical protein
MGEQIRSMRKKTRFETIYKTIVVVAITLLPIGMYFGVFGSFRNEGTNILTILASIALVPLAIIIGVIGKQFEGVWHEDQRGDFNCEMSTDPFFRNDPSNIWHNVNK